MTFANLFPQQPAGQPGNASATEQAGPNGSETPDIATLLKEIRELKEKFPRQVESAISEYDRKQQSARDNALRTLEKKVNDRIRQFQAVTGQPPTDEQVAKIRETTAKDGSDADLDVTSPTPSGQEAEVGARPTGDAYEWKRKLLEIAQKEAGVTLTAEDLAGRQDSEDAVALLTTLREAAQAKKQRLEGEAAGRSSPLDSGAVGGNPIANVNDPDQLWALARKKRSRT